MKEIWKPVVGYEGRYDISNLGRVKSLPKARNSWKEIILSQNYNRGYARIGLPNKKGKMTTLNVHRLVAETFIPNPLNLPEVNHKDENPSNNCVENLEWVTHKENMDYGTAIQRAAVTRGIPVLQYSLDGKFVNEWGSLTEAARAVSPTNSKSLKTNIARACRGERHQALGFVWKFKSP